MQARLLVPIVMLIALGALVVTQLPGDSSASPSLTASSEVKKLIVVIESDVGMSQKLAAFEKLRKKGSADAIAELVSLTDHSDPRVSSAACATLGRIQTETSKGKLKSIIENTAKKTELRTAAMNALACHGSSSDRSWIESKTKNDSKLGSHFTVVSKTKFWK